jgi:hypothetical protein
MNNKYKFPRIYHAPWSENLQNDDRKHPDMQTFENQLVVVTLKMDGENTSCYSDIIHARSIDSQNANHPSRDMVKSLWGQIKHLILHENRICGENLYAEHSIKYNNLFSYFYIFSIWKNDVCSSWEDVLWYTNYIYEQTNIKLFTVPVIYQGIYDEKIIKQIGNYYLQNGYMGDPVEGYVIRKYDEFSHNFEDKNNPFCLWYAKVVRKNHVQTDKHWLRTWNKDKINKLI